MKSDKVIKYLVSVVLAVILLYFSFKGVDWVSFRQGLEECRWMWVALAMLTSIVSFVIRSERWRRLMLPIDDSIRPITTYNAVCICYLANFVFPRIGEIVKCGVVSRRQAAVRGDKGSLDNVDKYIGTVVMEKSFDIVSVFALFAILLVARWEKFGAFFTENVAAPLASGGWKSVVWAALGAVIIGAVVFIIWKMRGRSAFLGKVSSFLKGLWEGFRICFTSKGGFVFLIYTIALWLSYTVMSWCIIRSLPVMDGMGFVDAMFVCAAGGLGWIIPVPGGFGAYHGIVALAVSSIYALSWESGILCATLNHEAQAVTMLVCGIISYFVELFRNRQ
ncbi:MAG: flippase-like domain-containing protein [Bacteroidales bacterium]|nr:flippase-like domain-containing protein [Bacteroidales bacterium]